MGAGASAGVAAAVKATSDSDIKAVIAALSPEDREKLLKALGPSEAKSSEGPAAASSPQHPIEAVAAKDGGKTVLVIAASPMGSHSATNTVGAAFLKSYKEKHPNDGVKVLDISKPGALPSFTAARVQSKFKLFSDASAADSDKEWADTKKLIEEFKAADKYVFLAPLWNFGLPYTLKLYIDHIIQPHLTFGLPDLKGLVAGKPALVIRAAGGTPVGSEMDTGYAYLRAALGFIGFTDIRLLGITGTANPACLPKLLEEKSQEATALAAHFDFDASAALHSSPPKAPEVKNPEPAPIKEGTKVLFVTSSPMGEHSATKAASTKFIEVLKETAKVQVTTVDLADGSLQDFTAAKVQAKFATWGGGKDACPADLKKEWDYSVSLMDQLKEADVYIFAVPMWNLGAPYTMKQWFDHITQPHRTFDPATYKGLLENKRAFVIASSGNGLLGTPLDHITPVMKQALGFIGVSNVSFTFVKNKDSASDAVDELKKLCSI
jgi:FMN-dependent NADH-azoreductase